MDSSQKHDMWEMLINERNGVCTANQLIAEIGENDQLIIQSILKSHISNAAVKGKVFIKCAECFCPLIYVAESVTACGHFKHDINRSPDLDVTHSCFYYSKANSFFGTNVAHLREGQWHINTKQWLVEQLKQSLFVDTNTIAVERYIFSKDPEVNGRRRPDISFSDTKGNHYAIELTRWWISPVVVAERETFFRDQNINLIWLFSPDCQERNIATFNLILFGSPTARKDLAPHSFTLVECNAFVLTDEAKLLTEKYGILHFEVRYPVGEYQRSTNSFDIELKSVLSSLDELKLSPAKRLPYVIQSSLSFEIAQQEHKKSKRLELVKRIKLIRKAVGTAAKADRLEIIEEICEQLYLFRYIADDYRFQSHLEKRVNIAKKQLSNNKQAIREQIVRADRCKRIVLIRSSVNQKIRLGKYSSTYFNAGSEIEHLEQMWGRISTYAAFSLIKKRFERANKLMASVMLKQDEEIKEKQDKGNPDYINLMEEVRCFSEMLTVGFDELPTRTYEIKLTRLVTSLRSRELNDEASHLVTLFNFWKKRSVEKYRQQNFPKLSKGWNDKTLYKDELDKAMNALSKTYSSKNSKEEMCLTEQVEIKNIIQRFTEQIIKKVDAETNQISKLSPKGLEFYKTYMMDNYQGLLRCAFYVHNNLQSLEPKPLKKLYSLKEFCYTEL
ncbi:hypothetical protein VSAL_p840_65 (plasmid) [Aliivibrio salmonicida LFI1238]|uniref:Competence protein CoiA nuclease-like domain-containing protein n=1 Tax=Aliivibrio salmonicida (strain LFI1238) TaxID=316275 RepID=B6ET36_ALISL|nr:hypothetical protein [Aliivibrio salmonicida]CAQ81924.1 hypothetical protein VSAL_p840_65 [Aliivibrio salmonicida LFI1238]